MSESKPARVTREAHLRWVPIEKMRVVAAGEGQRELRQAWVDHLLSTFDLEQLGAPTVSSRDGFFYIIDGQHRIEALRQMGWGDQQIQCWTYEDLTQAEEAEKFLQLNDTLTVNALAKFKSAVTAGRTVECDIDRIVRAQGLNVSADQLDGSIQAVGTLRRVYSRSGSAVLARTLRIIRDAYGDPGLESAVLDGIGHLCGRYNGELQDEVAVLRLSKAMGGVSGLLNKAETHRRATGNAKGQCVAAAAVDIINAGRGGKKLPSWWTEAAA